MTIQAAVKAEPAPIPGCRYEIREMDPRSLSVDQRYQRHVSTAKLEAMAKESWDPMRAGALNCVSRGGKKVYITDGQHRQALAIALKIPTVLCLIWYSNAEPINEPLLFVATNTLRKQLGAADRFKALLEGGDKSASDVNEVLEAFNLKLALSYHSNKALNEIKAIYAVMKIYKQQGKPGLYNVINIITEIWPTEPAALEQVVLSGTAQFLATYSSILADRELSIGKVIDKLRPASLSALIRSAMASTELYKGSAATNFARALVATWNRGKTKNRLPEDLLS